MNSGSLADDFREAHDPHWVLKSAFQLLVFGLILTEALLGLAVQRGLVWLAVLLVIIAAHLMHGMLIGLHEAAHGLLRKSRRFNEFDGTVISTLSFMSFSLYRVVHQAHHAYLASERDCELWPFSNPEIPRWRRCLAAFCELNFGLFYTPFVFLRVFLSSSSSVRNERVRRRVWAELGLVLVVWSVIFAVTATLGLWKYFLLVYLAPALLAANLQSWRKYIEHVGMTGDTVNGVTRSIVARSLLGRLFAFSLLHEPFHGVHHQRAGLPHSVLPQYAEKLQPRKPGERRPYPSYRNALIDLMRCLTDPRVGPQWRRVESQG
ncbi:MAG TPA: fatty acid desaturase [Chthoniobacterales bacterium]|jgi:fatty acid desaturase